MKRSIVLVPAMVGMLLAFQGAPANADRDYLSPQGEWVGGPHPFPDRGNGRFGIVKKAGSVEGTSESSRNWSDTGETGRKDPAPAASGGGSLRGKRVR